MIRGDVRNRIRAKLALPSKGMSIGAEVLVTGMITVSMGDFLEVEYNGKTFLKGCPFGACGVPLRTRDCATAV